MSGEVVIRRTIRASRERVFAAWLDPAMLARFMMPGDVTSATAEVDARIGGRFRIVMEHGRGNAEHWGEYLAIDAPSRLSFTWISGSTDLQPTVVTIELFDRNGGTELVLTHRGIPDRTIEPHRSGWGTIAGKLEAALR